MVTGWKLEDYLKNMGQLWWHKEYTFNVVKDGKLAMPDNNKMAYTSYFVYLKLKETRERLNKELARTNKALDKLSKKRNKTDKVAQMIVKLEIEQQRLKSQLDSVNNQIEYLCAFNAMYYNYVFDNKTKKYFPEANSSLISKQQSQYDMASEKIYGWFQEQYSKELDKKVKDAAEKADAGKTL